MLIHIQEQCSQLDLIRISMVDSVQNIVFVADGGNMVSEMNDIMHICIGRPSATWKGTAVSVECLSK